MEWNINKYINLDVCWYISLACLVFCNALMLLFEYKEIEVGYIAFGAWLAFSTVWLALFIVKIVRFLKDKEL